MPQQVGETLPQHIFERTGGLSYVDEYAIESEDGRTIKLVLYWAAKGFYVIEIVQPGIEGSVFVQIQMDFLYHLFREYNSYTIDGDGLVELLLEPKET